MWSIPSCLLSAFRLPVGYEYTVGFDDKPARAEAVLAVVVSYVDAPSSIVEDLLTDQYWNETERSVRLRIVEALGEHGYSSQTTRDVLLDAKDDYDDTLAAIVQRYLDQIP